MTSILNCSESVHSILYGSSFGSLHCWLDDFVDNLEDCCVRVLLKCLKAGGICEDESERSEVYKYLQDSIYIDNIYIDNAVNI